jgi:subtilisin-like proprotein convertase family protein
MNSAVKQHPRYLSRLVGRWTALAALLMALPALGQVPVTGDKPITIVDATQVPGSNDSQASKANPYPAVLKVGDKIGDKTVQGKIQRVAVKLPSLSHSYLADVDILIANPAGVPVLLMSDVAVGQGASGDYIINPAGSANFPEGGTPGTILAPGTYKPTDFAPSEDFDAATRPNVPFAAPAPAAPGGVYSVNLADYASAANNTTIKGDWKLYIMDDRKFDAGTVGAPELQLWLSPVVSVTNTTVDMAEDTPFTIPVKIDDTDTPVADLSLRFPGNLNEYPASITNIIDPRACVISAPTGNEWRVTFNPKPNASGTVVLELEAVDKLGTSEKVALTVVVAPRNDAPTVNKLTINWPNAGTDVETNTIRLDQGQLSAAYKLQLGDIDSDTALLTTFAVSGDTNILLSTDFFPSGPGATPTFTIAAKGAATGSATLNIFAKDAEGSNSVAKSVNVAISPKTDRKVIANFTPIAVTESTTASSTSEITLSDWKAKIGRVRVTLADVSHPNPDQLDVVLVGPTGVKVPIMGQAGGANALNRTRLTFSDLAAANLPDDTQIATGEYKPTDYVPATELPGLPGPYANPPELRALENTDPNGKWTLYAVDRSVGGTGAINGGFLVEIFTKPTIETIANQTVNEDASEFTVPFTVGDLDGKVKTVTAVATTDDAGTPGDDKTMATISVSFTADATSGSIKIKPVTQRWGQTTVLVTVVDDVGFATTTTFVLKINSVNDVPTISPINKQVTYIGLPAGPASFRISDQENPEAGGVTPNLTIVARSSNLKLLPEGNIVIAGTGNDRTVTLYPVGLDPGTVDITLTVKDNDAGGSAEASTTFRLDVLSAASPLFVNQTKIVIQDTGAGLGATNATGSPFAVQVKDLVGTIQKVKVNLVGLKHPKPQDLDILLVAPNGKGVVLMSDAGGSAYVNNAQLLFSQDGGTSIAADSIASGTFRPTDLEGNGNDFFNSPFLVAGYPPGVTIVADLNSLAGDNPNGTWQLFVTDDTGNTKEPDSVIDGGWMLHIQTSPVFSAITPNPATTTEDKAIDFNIDIGDNQPGVPTILAVESTTDASIVDNSRVSFSEGGDNRKMTIDPKKDAHGTVDLVIAVTIGGAKVTQPLRLVVTPVNDDPTIAEIANKEVLSGLVLGPFNITIDDTETDEANLTVEATSANPLLPSSNVLLGGAGATRTVTILPGATIESFSSLITLTVSDPNGGKGQRSFTYIANRSLSFSNPEAIAIQDNTSARPYPSTISVKGVNGLVSKAYVTIRGFTHSFPDDVHILLVSPDGKKSVLMGNAGGPAPLNGVSNLILGFDDGAANPLPNEGKLSSGAWKPFNDGTPALPSPAPGLPYSSTLSAFNLIDPNGDWKLYVFDDTFSDDGSISGGWTLVLETAPQISVVANQVGIEDVVLPVEITISDADSHPTNVIATAVSTENDKDKDGNIVSTVVVVASTNAVFDPATTNQSVRRLLIKPELNVSGNVTNIIRVTATDKTTTVVREFKVSFQPVNDPPNIGTDTNLVVIAEDTQKDIVFYIEDVDSVLDKTNVVVTSDNQAVIQDKSFTVAGPTGLPAGSKSTLIVTCKPEANAFGDAFVIAKIFDKNATDPQFAARGVTLRVTSVNDSPSITSVITTTNVTAGGTIRDIPIRVIDVSEPPPMGETEAKNLVITWKSDNQAVLPDSNVVISQSGTNRLLTLTTVGSTAVPAPGVKLTLEVADEAGSKPRRISS